MVWAAGGGGAVIEMGGGDSGAVGKMPLLQHNEHLSLSVRFENHSSHAVHTLLGMVGANLPLSQQQQEKKNTGKHDEHQK
jgi:hypothetical protein